MRLTQLIWLGVWFIVLAPLLLPGPVLAQEKVIVQLESVDGSEISGTATLSVAGEGTNVVLDIKGLTPAATAQGTIHAGTCATPSASFASLPELKADATGKATATGSVRFRGTEDVALTTMTDGEHIIVIQSEEDVACGVIPQLAAPPVSLPVTGGMTATLLSIGMSVLGFCLLCTGLLILRLPRFGSGGASRHKNCTTNCIL
jgi:hypothetical protein